MEDLSETDWDLVISGTGLAQSLLALALSRSEKKILHVDRGSHYGGAEAALSLQDAEEWRDAVNGREHALFKNAEILQPDAGDSNTNNEAKLGFSRSYSLALGPQIIYSRSEIIPTLVSSKVYRQLEFLAVGSYWIYESVPPGSATDAICKGGLSKIPSSREDIFADQTIDLKSKRSLVKFLKLVADAEALAELLESSGNQSLEDYLTTQYKLSPRLQYALHALTLLPTNLGRTSLNEALPRIATHLRSIGMFGPGFCAVIPKWGGVAEISQVACRACAVGGGIYMLGKGIDSIHSSVTEGVDSRIQVALASGDNVRTQWVAGSPSELPSSIGEGTSEDRFVARSISVISSPLSQFFVPTAEGAPSPAATIAVFPPGWSGCSDFADPTYLVIHSSDTGECPSGQSVIYANTALMGTDGFDCLKQAVQALLDAVEENEAKKQPAVLWSLQYLQRASIASHTSEADHLPKTRDLLPNILKLPEPGTGLSLDDSIIGDVKKAWQEVNGSVDGFMVFEDREVGAYDDYDEAVES